MVIIPLYSNLGTFSFHIKLMTKCTNKNSAHLRISPHHSLSRLHLREALMRPPSIFGLYSRTGPFVNHAQTFHCLYETAVKDHSYDNTSCGRDTGGTLGICLCGLLLCTPTWPQNYHFHYKMGCCWPTQHYYLVSLREPSLSQLCLHGYLVPHDQLLSLYWDTGT